MAYVAVVIEPTKYLRVVAAVVWNVNVSRCVESRDCVVQSEKRRLVESEQGLWLHRHTVDQITKWW